LSVYFGCVKKFYNILSRLPATVFLFLEKDAVGEQSGRMPVVLEMGSYFSPVHNADIILNCIKHSMGLDEWWMRNIIEINLLWSGNMNLWAMELLLPHSGHIGLFSQVCIHGAAQIVNMNWCHEWGQHFM
jgi:hypothetical protein